MKKKISTTIKLLFICAAFFLISREIELESISANLSSIPLTHFILSAILLLIAQTISALRSRYYLATENTLISRKFSLALYLTGQAFNNLFPGGIGGDAYKLLNLNKLTGLPKLKGLSLLLSERASGLYILIFLAAILAFFSSLASIQYFPILIITAMIIVSLGYFLSIRIILKEQPKTALGAIPYSIFVQLFNLLVIIPTLLHLGEYNTQTIADFCVLFLLSNIAAILPISIGGAGIREVAMLYGANYLGLNPEIAVTLGVAYFIIYLALSLIGLITWPKLEDIYKRSNKK